jgi:hypothetical protein
LEFEGFDGMETAVDTKEWLLSPATAAMESFGDERCTAAGFTANEYSAVIIGGDANGFSE